MNYSVLRKIFRIPDDYTIDSIIENKTKSEIHCHSKKQGMWHNDIYSKTVSERRIRRVAHIMIEDTQVLLVITQRRFRFHTLKTCKWELLPGIKKRGKITDEFRKNSLRELQTDNYSQVGKKRGVVTPSV